MVHCERIFTAGASLTLAPGNEEDPLCMAPWKGRSYCQGWTLGGGAGNPGKEDPLARSTLDGHGRGGAFAKDVLWLKNPATLIRCVAARTRIEFNRNFNNIYP